MAYKMFSTGLVLALAGMCFCQQQQPATGSQYQQQQSAVSQASFQIGSASAQQTKLEDIERDSLTAAAYGQKTQPPQQPAGKSSSSGTAAAAQQQAPQPQAYQTVPAQQYFVQPYPAQHQQFYVQPYQAQPYQAAFDYAGVQYMFVNPSANQVYQQYYVPAVPQPSAVPQYVTKQSSSPAAAKAPTQQEYKAQAQHEYKTQQQYAATPAQAQQEYKSQQQFAAAVPAQALQQQQQQYVYTAPAYQYVQQPAAAAVAPAGSLDFSYVTRHPAAATAAAAPQFKAPAPAVQPQQYQYTAAAVAPQQQVQYQPQYYYTVPAPEVRPQEQQQTRVQPSAKSQYSSGVKSTTPGPVKESFAYKFESSPAAAAQQQSAYSTLRFSA